MKKVLNYFNPLFCGLFLILAMNCKKEDNLESTTPIDSDGNTYRLAKIGTQYWMIDDLKTTKYNDGTPIPYIIDNGQWGIVTTGAYCYYENDPAYKDYFGILYNWNAVNSGKLCPRGWHVPSKNEWMTLENYLIENGFNYDGSKSRNKIAKSLSAPTDWDQSAVLGSPGNDLTKNNVTDFTAYPGGYRYSDGSHRAFQSGFWWSSTEYNSTNSWYMNIDYDSPETFMLQAAKHNGCSIRCVKD